MACFILDVAFFPAPAADGL